MTAVLIAIIAIIVVALVATVVITRSRSRGRAAPIATAPSAPKTAPTPAPIAEAEPEPATYRGRLGTVRGLFSGAVSSLRTGKIDASTWESLEEALIRARRGCANHHCTPD